MGFKSGESSAHFLVVENHPQHRWRRRLSTYIGSECRGHALKLSFDGAVCTRKWSIQRGNNEVHDSAHARILLVLHFRPVLGAAIPHVGT